MYSAATAPAAAHTLPVAGALPSPPAARKATTAAWGGGTATPVAPPGAPAGLPARNRVHSSIDADGPPKEQKPVWPPPGPVRIWEVPPVLEAQNEEAGLTMADAVEASSAVCAGRESESDEAGGLSEAA